MNQVSSKLSLSFKEETFLQRNLELLGLISGDIQDIQLKLEPAFSQKIRLQLKIVLSGLGVLLFQEEGVGVENTINQLFHKVREQLDRLSSGGSEYII